MSEIKATQITWHEGAVTREERARLLKQKGCTLWFTGLSGSGKSTLAVALEQVLIQRGHAAYVLDGDNVRFGLNAGPNTLTSFISPYRKDRDAARAIHEKNKGGAIPFIEVHMSTPIEVCEKRDPKGLYKQARAAVAQGKGMGFTGVDDPYEAPVKPELTIDTGRTSTQEAVAVLLNFLQ